MSLARIFSINQGVVPIYYSKDINFFGKDLIDIILKDGWSIKEIKRYDLIFKMAISSLKGYFSLVIFLNLYLMIYIC